MNTFLLPNYPFSSCQIRQRIDEIKEKPLIHFNSEKVAIEFALHCIDLTTLEGSDSPKKIAELCTKAKEFETAAICVYPIFVKQAKQLLINTTIKVASVAGAFPSGQLPIELKVKEVEFAVSEGADEIDMVISRGKFLDGHYEEVYNEIVAIKKACQNAKLKVILETGELIDPDLIFKASILAMRAGADFIKTSTGKIPISATPEAFLVMLDAIMQHFNETKRWVGIKPAGGIADIETCIIFVKILENTLNTNYLTNSLFRIGASKVATILKNYLK